MPDTLISRFLLRIERFGNRLPHPTLLFIYLCALVLVLSALMAWFGVNALHPISGDTITAINLLSRDGLHAILEKAVTNFTHFAPVGTVLVAILGIGIAERSGLLSTVLQAAVLKASPKLLSFIVVLCGILSSLAADTGYVVLIPLAAIVFIAAGRHPIIGIAAAFAGVSGGFSANLLIGPIDALLAGISTEAAQFIDSQYQVSAAGNYYFLLISTLVIASVGTLVTEKIVAPRFECCPFDKDPHEEPNVIDVCEKRALKIVGLYSVLFIALLLLALVPENGWLRGVDGSVLRSPFMGGIVVIISLYAGLAGIIYGKLSGRFNRDNHFINAMDASMGTMASYLVLMFFAAQFVSYFNWSQLGIISAVKGSEILQMLQLSNAVLLVCFVFFAALINLLIGSASAKWALMAPIFVPMFMLSGISPEAAQVAYRIGDSSTNIITPLMPYFGVVVAFVQKYDKDAGMGTILAMMLPYSMAFLLLWSLLLAGWILLGLPLGPGSAVLL
jgi:aminobenzoyl-glutamate transport protein